LTPREREILNFLLSVEMPGVEELRLQAGTAMAEGPLESCCPSISLFVDRERAPQSPIRSSPAVDALSKERAPADRVFDLLLFVDDGWLQEIELVHYTESSGLDEFPPPLAFDEPFPHPP
jgi:hypothetical protein